MSQQLTIEQIAAIAWDLMKPDDDPLFHLCSIDHQQKLVYHAQDVQRSGIADDAFERQVKEVLADPERERLRLADKWAAPNVESESFVFAPSAEAAPVEDIAIAPLKPTQKTKPPAAVLPKGKKGKE